jgi:hypothetical protein
MEKRRKFLVIILLVIILLQTVSLAWRFPEYKIATKILAPEPPEH